MSRKKKGDDNISSEQIAEHTKEFMEKGGRIQRIGQGEMRMDFTPKEVLKRAYKIQNKQFEDTK